MVFVIGAIITWLFCGWLGGRLIRGAWRRRGLSWTIWDEWFARIGMLWGLGTLVGVLFAMGLNELVRLAQDKSRFR